MVSIVGRNGAGKSTLSKLICGFETPDSGEIFFDGQDLKDENIRRRARHIGYVMQNPNQMISKTMIFDEVALGLQGSGLTEAEIRARVEDTLKVCGLYPFRNWPISALSFGQKKRVTIASVLVQDPELIILDEPTAGPGFPTLHGHYGVPARAERQGCDRGDDHPRYAPDAGIHAAGAGLLRRAADCGPQRGGHPLRPGADRAGGA